jgi:hypothetical protein
MRRIVDVGGPRLQRQGATVPEKSCKRVSLTQNGHREAPYSSHEPDKDHDFVFIS